jgi:GT2 family glycosyltransferase
MRRRLDVIIPAYNEAVMIGACLRALLSDADRVDLRVVVVPNGCTDGTAEVARALVPGALWRGQELLVVEIPVAGKAAALNAGDPHRRGCPVVYLDADTVLTPGTASAMAEALDQAPARLVAPRPLLVRPRGLLARSYAAVWTRLPSVAGQITGIGCYAVNPAGRARWSTFPPVTGDDAYVHSRFAPDERGQLDAGGSFLVLPKGRELVRVVGRWHWGNVELARDAGPARRRTRATIRRFPAGRSGSGQTGCGAAPPPIPTQAPPAGGLGADGRAGTGGGKGASPAAGTRRNLAAVLSRPGLWPHLPGFLVINRAGVLARDRPDQPARRHGPARWEPALGPRAGPAAGWRTGVPTAPRDRGLPGAPLSARPPRIPSRVDVIVVTYRNRHTIDRCLHSLRSAWAELTVTVVDNASGDGTVAHLRRHHPRVELMANPTNVGFAAGVNQAAGGATGDFLLLANPDAELHVDAIDALLALAIRYPGAGLYGGRPVDDAGRLNRDCCLARPTLWHALAFGIGLSALRGVPVLDPDSLGGWRRDEVRTVPVLTGGLLLVDRDLWQRVGGFDDRYFLYGEDVDLCLRAARLGATPMFTPTAGYRHGGGGSSSRDRQTIGILRGRATLYRVHLPGRRARLAGLALLAGVWLRATVGRLVRPGATVAVWRAAWRRRREWRAGWPDPGGQDSTAHR